jgi:hypothetical protein
MLLQFFDQCNLGSKHQTFLDETFVCNEMPLSVALFNFNAIMLVLKLLCYKKLLILKLK